MGALAAGVALLFMQMHHAVHKVVHHVRLNVRPPARNIPHAMLLLHVQALQVSACSGRDFMAALWALNLAFMSSGV